ncbi:ATP-grasp domain-containing protein [Noviherbaspirillum saxi]|nr:ATP-grasp domain-containing protein [Noviherbaspirillum saxi]
MKTILITAIGGDIAQGVATVLREARPEYRLIGVDLHDQHGGTLFVDAFHRIPAASDAGYLEALKAVVDREGVDIVLPVSEPELAVLARKRFAGVTWLTCGEQAVAAGLDKLATAQRLASLGLPVPWTLAADEGLPPQFPCILKSRTGSGSRSVFVVKDSDDVAYLLKRVPDAVYQELLLPADREVTCAVFRAQDGRVATLQMLRKLVGGFTGWARIIDDAATAEMCKAIAEGLDVKGSINVQLRLTAQGPRVFEINPRFSSTTLMRHRLGFSDAVWALDDVEGRPFKMASVVPGAIAVRVQNAAVVVPANCCTIGSQQG